MLLASKRAADLGPEHKHFKVIEARDKGNDKVKCVYCSHEMVGGATRMRAHLLKHRGVGCTPCTGKTMPAHAWWSLYGGGYPELQRVAIRVLSQVISASASERNWSTYGFIHSKSRNRLQPARANKLVYVHSNLRLLDRTSGVSYEEQFPVWDFESEDEA